MPCPYHDQAHDAGYRGEEADQVAAALQQQEREAYEQWQADRQAAEQEAIDAAEAEQMYDAGEEPF